MIKSTLLQICLGTRSQFKNDCQLIDQNMELFLHPFHYRWSSMDSFTLDRVSINLSRYKTATRDEM